MTVPTLQKYLKKSSLSDPEKSSRSILMQDIFHKILKLAKLEATVFIVGEIGSGKKRLANIIHKNSNRSRGPFYSFYCVDIDENQYQEAFWGHLKFEDEHLTLKYDAIEKACGGTLYLDHFSQLSPTFMMKIIESFKKGVNNLFRHDKSGIPRLIISFNQESYQEIINTPVWSRLLDLLDPMVVMLPPLRERKEDIPILIEHFLNELREQNNNCKSLKISKQALGDCFNYNWPGNIRQLKNALLQGAILSYGQTIESRHLPFSMNWQLPYEFDGKRMTKW